MKRRKKKAARKRLESTPGRSRTCGLLIRNQLLYPLSYGGLATVTYYYATNRWLRATEGGLRETECGCWMTVGPASDLIGVEPWPPMYVASGASRG